MLQYKRMPEASAKNTAISFDRYPELHHGVFCNQTGSQLKFRFLHLLSFFLLLQTGYLNSELRVQLTAWAGGPQID